MSVDGNGSKRDPKIKAPWTMRKRNYLAGGVIIAVGFYVVLEALTYNLGTAARMGPGYLPLILGVLFMIFGIAIALVNLDEEGENERIAWRPVLLVLGSMLAFALLIESAGLIAATAALVIISSLADPSHNWKSVSMLFMVLLVSVYVVFEKLLGIPFHLIAGLS